MERLLKVEGEMEEIMSSTKRITTQQRIDWLLKNPKLWAGYGGNAHRNPTTTTTIEQRVFLAMQQAGLISKKTSVLDCTIWRWISKARKQRREVSARKDSTL
jgi:hypothetical protein